MTKYTNNQIAALETFAKVSDLCAKAYDKMVQACKASPEYQAQQAIFDQYFKPNKGAFQPELLAASNAMSEIRKATLEYHNFQLCADLRTEAFVWCKDELGIENPFIAAKSIKA